ncbi:Spy/CpxP family protein refolding chaperone [Caldimonas brevitalea]|uniref:Periplasmic heavy metal sensor n=1 Tax=Caldimonas brevitalea TaxID=413882 RepID=A0A0G3BFG1_9BURK|nr:Spy/CpxP family protein refolding chaperone [Caldimonas brevitalea]AKJ28057.1 hypothetical protein AAW51_1366 [Caldimonas brevitalea]
MGVVPGHAKECIVTNSPQTGFSSSSAAASPRRRSFKGVAAGLVIGLAAAAALPVMAFGAGGPHGHHGGGHHHGSVPGVFMGSPERVERMVDRWLSSVNATDAQRAQVKQIALAAASDLKAQREAGRALRQQLQQLFAQPTVDANAVEALRQQQLAHHDQVSRRITQAMLEVSRVLTPEQRAQLVERMKQRAERWQQRQQQRQQQQQQQQQQAPAQQPN